MTASKKKAKAAPKKSSFLRSVWLFPAILTLLLLFLTAFRISGTSIGIYNPLLYGINSHDSHLLANMPAPIRSDEWLVNTQLTIAQSKAGFPRINKNIDSGRDMSVVTDVPYKEWSTLFKPQNLSFFILPLENAFAFKWWLLIYLTIISCYFFTLRYLPGKRLVAAGFSIGVACSPFLFWWYQTQTLAPIFYGFFILLISTRMIDKEPIPFLRKKSAHLSQAIYSLGLAYLLVAFGLVLYPPFQVPVAIVVAAYLVGYYLDTFSFRNLLGRRSLKVLAGFLIAIILAGGTVLVYVHTRTNVIAAVSNTVYPGKRITKGGGTPVYQLFSTYLQPQLERPARAAQYYDNQSEVSNFILFLPFLVVPSVVLLFTEYKRTHKLNWTLLALEISGLIFFINLFVPGLQPFYKLLLLDKVPHARLFIGLGFLGVVQLLVIMRLINASAIRNRKLTIISFCYVLLCAVVLAWAGLHVRAHYPHFVYSKALIAGWGAIFCLALFCFLTRRIRLGTTVFLLFSIGCVFRIHPLYQGLGVVDNSRITQAIDSVSKPSDSWAALDNIYFENFPLLANRDSLSGVQPYPDVAFWRQVAGAKDDYIYNRYAHIIFNSDPAFTAPLKLIQSDNFQVRFACTPFVEKKVQFVLAAHQVDTSCTTLVKTVPYPALTFYLYQVH